MEVKLVLGSTGAMSLSTSGWRFQEALPFGNPQATAGVAANVTCRDSGGWCRVGACAKLLGCALQMGTSNRTGPEMC